MKNNMFNEKQVIEAIHNIINSSNVLENLKIISELDESVESETINLNILKSIYSNIIYNDNSDIHDLFDVILLEHDNTKTLYLIKGLKVIASNKDTATFSKMEIEEVRNLDRTLSDFGVKDAFIRVLKEARLFSRYRIINTK